MHRVGEGGKLRIEICGEGGEKELVPARLLWRSRDRGRGVRFWRRTDRPWWREEDVEEKTEMTPRLLAPWLDSRDAVDR